MSADFFENWTKNSIKKRERELKEKKEDDNDVHKSNMKRFKEVAEKIKKQRKEYEEWKKNKKTPMTTRKVNMPELHAQKVKDIEDYIKSIDLAHMKHEHKKYSDSLKEQNKKKE